MALKKNGSKVKGIFDSDSEDDLFISTPHNNSFSGSSDRDRNVMNQGKGKVFGTLPFYGSPVGASFQRKSDPCMSVVKKKVCSSIFAQLQDPAHQHNEGSDCAFHIPDKWDSKGPVRSAKAEEDCVLVLDCNEGKKASKFDKPAKIPSPSKWQSSKLTRDPLHFADTKAKSTKKAIYSSLFKPSKHTLDIFDSSDDEATFAKKTKKHSSKHTAQTGHTTKEHTAATESTVDSASRSCSDDVVKFNKSAYGTFRGSTLSMSLISTPDNPINCDLVADRPKFALNSISSIQKSTIWVQTLKLTVRDRKEIEHKRMLSDKHMYAAQKLLKRKFPHVAGMQDTCLSQTTFKQIDSEGLQIHHIDGNHWVLSSSIGGKVRIYDNLNDDMSDDLKVQVGQVYKDLSNGIRLMVEMMRVDQQQGWKDCGLFVIAMAYELCDGNDPTQICFEQKLLRKHLISCFRKEELKPFPQRPRHIRNGVRTVEKILF